MHNVDVLQTFPCVRSDKTTHLCLKETWGKTTPNSATEASMTDTPNGRGPWMASPTGTRR